MLHGSLTVKFEDREFSLPEGLVNTALQLAAQYEKTFVNGVAAVYRGDANTALSSADKATEARRFALKSFDIQMPALHNWSEAHKIDLLLEAAKQHKQWVKSN